MGGVGDANAVRKCVEGSGLQLLKLLPGCYQGNRMALLQMPFHGPEPRLPKNAAMVAIRLAEDSTIPRFVKLLPSAAARCRMPLMYGQLLVYDWLGDAFRFTKHEELQHWTFVVKKEQATGIWPYVRGSDDKLWIEEVQKVVDESTFEALLIGDEKTRGFIDFFAVVNVEKGSISCSVPAQ